ncbi:MAG: YraN family protein [Firmicutes bacterium]|nr:YraN family protein [Bacillota bacterium]
MNTKKIGDFGEKAAVDYLMELDYKIHERNFRLKFGEVDIIAEKDGCMVFIEVKTRKNNLFGEPSEYVDHKKQERIKRAAAVYADVENTEVRFDVIEVFYEEKDEELFLTKINHIENAF